MLETIKDSEILSAKGLGASVLTVTANMCGFVCLCLGECGCVSVFGRVWLCVSVWESVVVCLCVGECGCVSLCESGCV